MIRLSFLLLCIVFLSMICSCSQQPTIDTSEEDEYLIQDLETKLIEALSNKDLNQYVSLFADDATVFYPNNPPIIGKDALKQVWEDMFARPGFTLSMQAERSETSNGGDLAYAHGEYALSFNDENGTPVIQKGNYIVIFKKQNDGQWKIIIDIATPDLPAPEPSTE